VSQAPGTLQARSADDLERDYLQCLIAPDGRRARQLVEHALAAGVPAATIYLRVIVPAMHEIGRLWETAQLSVAQEHLATQITQAVIASLGLHLTAGDRIGAGRVAIASSTPGELHALAGQIVADFLEAQGWTVLALGADVPAHELVALAHEREAQLVALSTALPGHLLQVTRTCQLLRQLPTPPYIVAGGRAYGGDATRARAVGADAFADDPEGLLAHLREHFAGVEH
jgi:methanogenic corrinoid protein MtbC1